MKGTITITINGSEEIWKSPDGKRVLRKLQTDKGEIRTYSGKIANSVGQTLEVEAREEDKGHGLETFVKFPQQDNSGQGSSNGGSGGGNSGGGSNLIGIKVGHAINNGVHLAIADGNTTKESIKIHATEIYELSKELEVEFAGQPAEQKKFNPAVVTPPAGDAQERDVYAILTEKGLIDRVNKASVAKTELDTWLSSCGGDENKFAMYTAKVLSDQGF